MHSYFSSLGDMSEVQRKAFHALKPPCVELSQVALRYKSKKAAPKDIIVSLESLHNTVKSISGQDNALDSKLADYIFFPLSHIFRDSKELPVRAVEVALQCLQILISQGWRSQLSSELGKQLLILLCLLAGGSATDTKVKDVNEELSTAAFGCLNSLFHASNGTGLGASSVDVKDVPVLGHTVTVMLDGVTEGPSVSVRLSALQALGSLINCISDEEALKGIFPGIVSSLTKVLSSRSGSKPSYKVFSTNLDILTTIICKVMNDGKNVKYTKVQQSSVTTTKSNKDETGSWTSATSAQIRMALASIMPLRYHDRPEVRTALMQLCISIIQECSTSLSQSIPMLTETLIVLCSHSRDAAALFNVNSVFTTQKGLLDIIQNSLHDWIIALPRVMQSNDDTKRKRTIEQIATAFKLLENQDMNLDILNDSIAVNLHAGVSAAIQASLRPHTISVSSLDISQLVRSTNTGPKSAIVFQPVLFSESSNRSTMVGLQTLAAQLQDTPMSIRLQQDIVGMLTTTSKEEQLAALWLSLQLLNNASAESALLDQYLNLPSGQDSQALLMDDVYSFSLDVLSKSTFENEDSWKLQALALEAVALQARNHTEDFRPELVDALYPILERLGSNNASLQQHAITCLNIVSTACNYPNSASLVIDNADYLINALALKLNTFDISPQAPQVLVMMVRLCGSALIPYLDDLIESIFSILACYHGYPKLVESLFSALNAIVAEAAQSSARTIKSSSDTITRPKAYKPTTIAELASILRSNLERKNRPLSPPSSSPPPSPVPSKKTPLSQKDFAPLRTLEDDPPQEETPTDPPPPPPAAPSRTHTLITSIVNLTPAHLTTPSPPLRTHILTLLATAFPILAPDTDTFLPIAAQLFHPITTRLHDPEPYAALAAATALAALCECAGDFLSTRVAAEWDDLLALHKRVEKATHDEMRTRRAQTKRPAGGGGSSTTRTLHTTLIALLLALIRNVQLTDEMEDDVFETLGPLATERADVRRALEGLNADALWLAGRKNAAAAGGEEVKPESTVAGWEFADVV